MARITDSMKIEKIKHAIMEIICEHGYRYASIALISEKSGVSTGYLYRYYSSKDELIQDLIDSYTDEIRDRILNYNEPNKTVYDFLYKLIDRLFEMANMDPIVGKFIAKEGLETNNPEWLQDKKDYEFKNVTDDILKLGRETGEISSKYDSNDLEVLFSTLPFRYIWVELSKDKDKKFTQEEVVKLTEMCMKAIR